MGEPGRLLDGIDETRLDRRDRPTWTTRRSPSPSTTPDCWPTATRLLIRRVRLDIDAGQVSADPRARRRRTLRPDQRALPNAELAELITGRILRDRHVYPGRPAHAGPGAWDVLRRPVDSNRAHSVDDLHVRTRNDIA